ncbi:MAG: hypothetical protein D6725_16315, partial [Planctomycetota bacterium]
EHVAYHRSHPEVREPHAIVRPATLPRERQIDICAHCHGNSVTFAAAPFSFRPGRPLTSAFKPFRTRHPEQDHVANQVTYLQQSRCFRASDSMTCTTCHDPHQPRSDTNAGHVSCLQCHDADHCTDRPNLPPPVRDACVDCHMPSSPKIQVSFRTADDDFYSPVRRYEHRIAVYPLARDATLLRWYSANAGESTPKLDALRESVSRRLRDRIDGLVAEHRFLAAIAVTRDAVALPLSADARQAFRRRLRELTERQATIEVTWQRALHVMAEQQWQTARSLFERILTLQPTHAGAHGRLGTVLAQLGDMENARRHLEKVSELDPEDAYGESMLGWIALLSGTPQQAAVHYRRAAAITPWDERIQLRLAMALAQTGKLREAHQAVQRALQIAPQFAEALLFAARLALARNDGSAAYRHAVRAARITGCRDVPCLLTLCDAAIRTDRIEVARQALAAAAAVAPPDDSSLTEELAIRQRQLQSRDHHGG